MKLTEKTKRRFRYGSASIMLLIAAIVVFTVINLVLEQLPMSVDLTSEGLYSISDDTKTKLESLSDDIDIIMLYDRVRAEADTQQAAVVKLLDEYDRYDHINVSYIDPYTDPSIVKKTVGETNASQYSRGDYIVKSGDRTKRIPASSMFETTTEYTSDSFLPTTYTTGMQVEKQLTKAIYFVTNEDIPIVYFSIGGDEIDIDNFSYIITNIEDIGASVQEINLNDVSEIPADASVIVFMGPQRDLTQKAYNLMQDFLTVKGGKAFFAMDYLAGGTRLDNFNKLFGDLYGVALNNDIVQEIDKYLIAAAGNANSFTATTEPNGPLSSYNKQDNFYIFNSRSIEILSTSGSFEALPLLSTSSVEATSISMIDGSKSVGKKTLGVCATNSEQLKNSKIVVLGSTNGMLDTTIEQYEYYRGGALFRLSMSWMIDDIENPGDAIETKQYDTSVIFVSTQTSNILAIFAILVYPIMIIAVGIVIWLRRRHL